jgi:hypothetical protein
MSNITGRKGQACDSWLPAPGENVMHGKTLWLWTGCLVGLALLATACRTTNRPDTGSRAGSVPEQISCEVYYSPAPGQAADGTTLNLSTGSSDRQVLDFKDLRFEASLVVDLGEGLSLALAVSDLATGNEVARALYQIDQQRGLVDQFIGGHGFTGLAYVFHPTSGSQLQYYCLASP